MNQRARPPMGHRPPPRMPAANNAPPGSHNRWRRNPHHWYWRRHYWDNNWYDRDYYYDWYDYDWNDYDGYDYDWDNYLSPQPQPPQHTPARPARMHQYLKVAPPLMMSLLEYTRTQAESEVDSQSIVNNMVSMMGDVLDMKDYETIITKSPATGGAGEN
jgi:hypothetical protein